MMDEFYKAYKQCQASVGGQEVTFEYFVWWLEQKYWSEQKSPTTISKPKSKK